MSRPLRILYLIDSLASGGAQRQLVTLISGLNREDVDPQIAVYHPVWHFRPELDALNVPIMLLPGKGGKDARALIGLIRTIRKGAYDIVHSYLRTPGVLVRLAAPFSGRPKIIVSERNTDLSRSTKNRIIERLLAPCADIMITNAESVKQETETLIPAWRKRIRVVPNGYSWVPPTDELLLAASELRKRLGARADELILGVVARLAPQKDPEILINALNLLPDHILQRIRVLWVGAQVDAELARRIRSIAKSHRYAGRLIIIPETRNIRAIYLGIDALLLVSKWEGFPNVLLEALAEGKAVIATDVGDVRYLVKDGRSGWVISAGDESGLADAIQQLVSLSEVRRKEMGQIGARHVREKYSQDRLVENTLAVYREIITLRKYE